MDIVKRSDKVAFLGITTSSGQTTTTTYHRMTGFTEMSTSKNAIEYNRQYVDEAYESTDITGYSPSISYAFDEFSDSPVHAALKAISDGELTGEGAIVNIVIVDFTQEGSTTGTFAAISRDFVVIPDSEGDSTDAYTYSGTFKVRGERITGTATTTDAWQTCSFTADSL